MVNEGFSELRATTMRSRMRRRTSRVCAPYSSGDQTSGRGREVTAELPVATTSPSRSAPLQILDASASSGTRDHSKPQVGHASTLMAATLSAQQNRRLPGIASAKDTSWLAVAWN